MISEDVDIQKELDKAEKETVLEAPAPETVIAEPVETPAEVEAVETVEPAIETAPEVKAKPEKKMVPLPALQEARKETKELREQMKRIQDEGAARLAEFQKRLESMANPPAPKPGFADDPANFLKDKVDQLEVAQANAQRLAQEAQLEQAIAGRLNSSEVAFAKEHADYGDAAKHLADIIHKNLTLVGVPQERHDQAFRQEVRNLTIAAAKAGREPAELIYDMAKNYGYAIKTVKSKAEEKIETIKKGEEVSTTLGSGGKAESGSLSLDSIARMDDDDFVALIADDKKWKSISKLMS